MKLLWNLLNGSVVLAAFVSVSIPSSATYFPHTYILHHRFPCPLYIYTIICFPLSYEVRTISIIVTIGYVSVVGDNYDIDYRLIAHVFVKNTLGYVSLTAL